MKQSLGIEVRGQFTEQKHGYVGPMTSEKKDAYM